MLVGWLIPDVALAQSKQDRADAHTEKAVAHYQAGDYDAAIVEFTKAYDLVRSTSLLYNLGRAHQKKGDKRTALKFFRQYLRDDPNGGRAGKAKSYASELALEIARAEIAAERLEREKKRERVDSEAKRKERERRLAAEIHASTISVQAQAYFDAGVFDKAATSFLGIYEETRNPEFLYKAARSHHEGGELKLALSEYKQYLSLASTGRSASDARTHAATIEKELAPKVIPDKKGGGGDKQGGGTDTAGTVTKKAPARNDGKGLRIAGIATAGAGVLAMGLGVKFGLDASSASDKLSTDTSDAWTDNDRRLIDKGEAAQRNMFISYGIGAVAIGVGGYLYYSGAKRAKESRRESGISVSPVISESGTGFAISGTF